MNNALKITLSIVVLLLISDFATGQFRGSNLAEYQLGNIPGEEPTDLSTLYNQLNLGYRYKKLSLSSRAELFQPSVGEGNDYVRLSQFRASYQTKHLNLDVGNLYSSFGRGLLMRNYEIPSSVFESRSYRVRYGFYKDMQGVSAKFKSKYVNVKLMRGTVLTVDLPPTLPDQDRRTDLIEGGEIDGNFKGQTLGFIFMRHHNSGLKNNYASLYYNGNIQDLTIYGEFAKRMDSLEVVSSFGENDAWGGYLGINYSWNTLGVSLEYKSYQNFLIGNGINDPPTLIKEHSSRLLNRSTHVPLLIDEDGYQVEVFYGFGFGNSITLNHAWSENELATASYIFREYYIDLTAYATEKILTKAFFDYAIDPLVGENNRYTAGSTVDVEHGKFSSTITAEAQFIERFILEDTYISNYFGSYTFAQASKFGITALLEISNDPNVQQDDSTINYFPSVSATYHFNSKNRITAFYGKRRGGPACSSGVCYDVLDFEGLELRLNTRF